MRKIYISVLFMVSGLSMFAQWTQNTLVNTEASSTNAGTLASAATSDGKTWMTYFKQVPAPNYYEMRAQLLDKDGIKLLGTEGTLVNNIPSASFTSFYNIAVDASNNLIVAFAATTSPNTIYVNKISTGGNQVWNSAGISFSDGLNPKLGVMANGDIIVSWLDLVSSPIRSKMQRLAAATGATVWATPIDVVPATATHRTFPGHILPLSDNGFIHVFHNRTSSIGTASTLWAQRYNLNGVAQWAVPVQLSNKTTAYNREYFPLMNNDTLYISYFAATGVRVGDAYVQKLFPDGTIPWGINGSDFSTDATVNYELETRIAIVPSERTVWASSLITNTNQSSQGTFVQKFDMTTGARLLTDFGKAVYLIMPAPYIIPNGISIFSDNLPVLMVSKYNSAISQYFYAAKLDINGNFVWPGDTVALAKYEAAKGRMGLTNVVNDQAVATWTENKGTEDRPYAQPIRIDGTTGAVAPVANFIANNTIICRGSTVQYTSTSTGAITSYSWSFPGGTPATSTSASPVVTYNTNGVYSATLTVSNGVGSNTLTRTNYITVNGVTPVATIAGSATGCAGLPNIFSVSGIDLGTAPTYNWLVNGIAVGSTGTNFTYTNSTAGTYQISCNVISNATCAVPAAITSNTIALTVSSVTPVATITGSTTVCAGQPNIFSVSGTDLGTAPTYNWLVNGIAVGSTGTNFTYTNSTAGTYQVSCNVISNATCAVPAAITSNTIALTVSSVTPVASITGSTTICAGQSNIFSVSGTNFGTTPTYSWMVNGVAVGSTASSFAYSSSTAGTAQVTCKVTSNAACAQPITVTSNLITVTVNSYPVISLSAVPAAVCISDTAFTLTGSPVGGIFSGTGVSGSNLFTPLLTGVGSKTITYTVSQSGCTSINSKIIVVNECAERHLRLDQYGGIIVQGNPNNGRFSLRLNSDLYTKLNMEIYNSMGQKVKSQQVAGVRYGSVIQMDILEKPAGVYHLRISNNETGKEAKKSFSIIKY